MMDRTELVVAVFQLLEDLALRRLLQLEVVVLKEL